MLSVSVFYCFTRTTCTVLGSISNFLPGGACGTLFTYPAATTSLNVFGRRWCSKLYLRNAWVSSPSAAASSAPDAAERAIPAGASAADLPGSAAGAGADGEFSECLPQAVRRRTMVDGRIRRGVIRVISQNF